MQGKSKPSQFKQVLQNYSDWFSDVVRVAFYPEKVSKTSVRRPDDIQTRLQDMAQDDQIAHSLVTDIISSQTDLRQQADVILQGSERPTLEQFDLFLQYYDDFIQRLERLDLDKLLSDFGIDAATGLRSAAAIMPDIERELERRARRGHPFSIILCKIDHPDPTHFQDQMLAAVKCMKKCMRSFDDAYLSGRNEILMSLKQTENDGALRFIERLKYAFTQAQTGFTMSFCVAEPMPGDNLHNLIANVRSDLKSLSRDGEAAEYEEMSPLQRYIKTMPPGDKPE